jgi:ubiquinone/menaquinone biosynthesis C-methylase UbiE
MMKAVRLDQCFDDPESVSSEFGHMQMYTGRLSSYYYRRFDQALNEAKPDDADDVLIIGGGTGVFALSIGQIVNSVHLTDIPREDPPFATAQKLFAQSNIDDSSISYVSADATELPYPDDEFDILFALDVLEHIPNEDEAVAEMGRVIKRSGMSVVSAPIEIGLPLLVRETYRFIDGRRRHTQSFRELLSGIIGDPTVESPGYHRGYDYRSTINRLQSNFDDVSVNYCPLPPLKWINPTAIITAQGASKD